MQTSRGVPNNDGRKRKFWIGLWVMSLLLAVTTMDLQGFVQAQDAPSLVVSPAETRLNLNGINTVVLDLVMADVVDMQSIDISITFDPDVVQLDGYQKGSFIGSFSQIFSEEKPGYVMISYVKLGAPALSGDGVVLQLTFSGLSLGTSSVDVSQTVYSKPSGDKVYPSVENGSIHVGYIVSDVTASVHMQGRSVASGVEMTMTAVSNPEYGSFTQTSSNTPIGNVVFAGLIIATYRVTTDQPRYLNVDESLDKQVLVNADVTLPPLNLLAGNAYWADNIIDVSDASLVGVWYTKTEADLGPGETLDADVNFDGKVDLRDLALVGGNYGLSSQEAYADWLP